ncbi:MAG: dihydrolipoyllysine-residue succinyltransferase [Xanthomonadales bacterium]|nr:dihydrolipoyllysine-residue succinyltransferase [Xanthomonadales bacterium]
MSLEVKVPVLPESVADAVIAAWHKKVGDSVRRDENLVDLETDKVVLEVPAPADGVLKEILKKDGDTVTGQQVIAIIEQGAVAEAGKDEPAKADPGKAGSGTQDPAKAAAAAAPAKQGTAELSPAAQRVASQHQVDPGSVEGTGRGGRVIKEDVQRALSGGSAPAPGARGERRVPMTRMRTRIAERMMESKNSIAMLTSFNEVNLAAVSRLRKEHGEAFEKAHGVRLGFMSFFVKAAAEALRRHPVVNASTEGNDILYHDFADISIAVSTDRGLVTPVLRNAETLGFAEIEAAIAGYAKKAREGGLALEDLQGGTFTITNGGVFGSLLSTPIVNPPQSAILGMHTIKERAIVEKGQVVAAPMMYIALSYDHRIIDGKDAVTFLVDIKNQLEDPSRMLFGL